MCHLETYIDPTTTNQLLNNLSLAIDETKLVLNINKLNKQVYKIESSDSRTDGSIYLRNEVTVLEVQLNRLLYIQLIMLFLIYKTIQGL